MLNGPIRSPPSTNPDPNLCLTSDRTHTSIMNSTPACTLAPIWTHPSSCTQPPKRLSLPLGHSLLHELSLLPILFPLHINSLLLVPLFLLLTVLNLLDTPSILLVLILLHVPKIAVVLIRLPVSAHTPIFVQSSACTLPPTYTQHPSFTQYHTCTKPQTCPRATTWTQPPNYIYSPT